MLSENTGPAELDKEIRKMMTRRLYLLLPLFPSFLLLAASSEKQQSKVFVVYLGGHSSNAAEEIQDSHHSFLLSLKQSDESARESLLYSYTRSMNGFAALLSEEEAASISGMEGVVSVFPSEGRSSLHTTRSWDFIGLEEELSGNEKDSFAEKAKYGDGIIIGMLDSGIWPESESFNDKGMGPVPQHWKGICEEGEEFTSSNCNRKIIGARSYLKGYESFYGRLNTSYAYRSPRDHDGHGTHTASIAAGRPVRGTTAIGGFAFGTSVGGAPLARLAVYKVCWPIPGPNPNVENTCFDADMLAAIDDAVADGVDVLSISIGANGAPPKYTMDPIAIGTLHAVKRGVVSVCSAGNSGPALATVSNLAPWVITVGASSIDRAFDSPVTLGNGVPIMGQTVTPYNQRRGKHSPLVYAGDAEVPSIAKNVSGQCLPSSLATEKAKGKAVLCLRGAGLRVAKGMEVKRAGGTAMILGNGEANGDEIPVDAHVLPASAVSSQQAAAILTYIKSVNKPTVLIGRAVTVVGVKGAPAMTAFSSRGPNSIEPNLLKPDITAPGLNIVAAWSEASSPTKLENDHRSVKYNLMSGTSMSCPHVSATAALLKSRYPRWSSAAIRSAITTTATVENTQGRPIVDESDELAGPMAFGSGHLRPTHASNPGLIYDASYIDYLIFACASKGTGRTMDTSFTCPTSPRPPSDLNHPSITVRVPSSGSVTVSRTVSNAGSGPVRYGSIVVYPSGFCVEVRPTVLRFKEQGEKKKFWVTIAASSNMSVGQTVLNGSGSLTWSDGTHFVRSPIVVNIA